MTRKLLLVVVAAGVAFGAGASARSSKPVGKRPTVEAAAAVGSSFAPPRLRRASKRELAQIRGDVRQIWSYESSGLPGWAKPVEYRYALLPAGLHPRIVEVRIARTKPAFASAAVELWNRHGRWVPGTAIVVFKWVGRRLVNYTRPWDWFAGPATAFPLACTAAMPAGARALLCPNPWTVVGYPQPRLRSRTSYSATLRSDDLRRVRWRDIAVPAAACGTARPVQLHNGEGFAHSLIEPWWRVIDVSDGWARGSISYGDLEGDGHDEAAVTMVCSNGGGTADGQLAFATVIFTARHQRLRVIGIVRPQEPLAAPTHPAVLGLVQIRRDEVIANEGWYGPNDSSCCASGRAKTIWKYTNGRLHVACTIVIKQTAP